MKNIQEVIGFVIQRLNAIIFELEQIKMVNDKKYTIEIKENGNVIKVIDV